MISENILLTKDRFSRRGQELYNCAMRNLPVTITKDDQATGIESLTPALSEGEGAWYSLDGKKLQQKPTKKGIYIVNGKKMVVNNK